ncbi:MAG: hypothetical protein J5774_00545 [Clostridia bacterium]|nr:hypothetical protein [Clostridia bacterium]
MAKRKKILICSIAVFALFLIGAGVFVGVVFFSPMSNPLYVAHRGYSANNPPNTPLAFAAATNKDFWGIETDIRFTKDGIAVCNHDATVKYADGTELSVLENDYATLRAKPLENKQTSDLVYLCPFTEYLDLCAYGDKVAVIELKTACSDAELLRLLTIVDLHHSREKCCFISFDYSNLSALRVIAPGVSLQYLSDTKDDPTFDKCLEDGVSIDVKFNVVNKKLVEKFHEKDLKVNVWTINGDWYRAKMRRLKVDFITSDCYYKN